MAPSSERLFVDLIYRSSRKYANWDPEITVKVGDYGRITQGRRGIAFWRKPQGTFLKEDNIYEDGLAEKYELPHPVEHGTDSTEGATFITSKNAQEVNLDASISAQTPVLAQCSVKASYKFSSGRGAILAMANDSISALSTPGKLRRLLDEDKMKNLVIVSEVHQCSSFARYLNTNGSSTVALGLSVDAPAVGNIAGSVKADAKWVHSASAGNFKEKVDKTGKRAFYPLFRLVSLTEGPISSGLRGELDEDPPLPDAEPPWAPMDDSVEIAQSEVTLAATRTNIEGDHARDRGTNGEKRAKNILSTGSVFRLPLLRRRK